MGKEINAILGAQTILIWTFAITFNTYLYLLCYSVAKVIVFNLRKCEMVAGNIDKSPVNHSGIENKVNTM